MSDKIARRIFIAAVLLLCMGVSFAVGVTIQEFEYWPYKTLRQVWLTAKGIVDYGELAPPGRRVPAPAGASRKAFTIHDASKMLDGYYVFVGWGDSENHYAAWLYDSRGTRRHTWLLNYTDWDPDGPSGGSENPHPFHVMPDGSIMVGFDKGDVLIRLAACGQPIWVKPGIYHHAMSRADDGSFWVWRGEGTAFGHYQFLENFDPETGKTIRQLALVEDIIKPMGASSVVFGVRPDFPFKKQVGPAGKRGKSDIFHPNDIDALPAKLAPLFPMFEPGDLLLSFRSINLIAVIDSDTGATKWWQNGPWIGQHDPDFTADGRISIYDNNSERGRSEILKIDPASRELSNDLFNGSLHFYSNSMGTHQYLPNGNVLLVVPDEGRILEVSGSGDMVMEFNNLPSRSRKYNEHVQNGVWVPRDYFEQVPHCSSR